MLINRRKSVLQTFFFPIPPRNSTSARAKREKDPEAQLPTLPPCAADRYAPPGFYVYLSPRRFSRIERCTNRSLKRNIFLRSYKYSNKNVCGTLLAFLEMTLGNAILYVRNRFVHSEIQYNRIYPFAPENFTAKTHFEAIRDLFWSLYGY